MERQMDMQKVFQFREGVKFFDFEEYSFVIDTFDHSLYSLGMSSALISANLDGKNNLETIMGVIRRHFDVSAGESESAVAKFIVMMQQKNLIQESE